jgi:AcrR family transcriptional regulator
MPAQPKTSDAEIVSAARALVEKEGADALSMQLVADAVGVRAPSLYKRFPNRDALLESVALDVFGDLEATLTSAARGRSPVADLAAMARAYRAFARRSPRLYSLLFATNPPDAESATRARAVAAEPALRQLAQLVDEARVLPAARFLTSFLHGFVSMELAGAFRLGGNIDEAFTFGVDTLLGALAAETPAERRRAPKRR